MNKTKEMLGLYGDGIHDDTQNIQKLLDKCGEIYIPGGKYLITEPLVIHDNTYLHSAHDAHYRLGDHANCSLIDNDGLYKRCINCNITIDGGIWDGNNDKQQRKMIDNENLPCDYDEYIDNQLGIFMIRFVHTKNLVVKNVTFRDPVSFAIHIADAEYFRVENIMLDYNLEKLNMDGVHIQGPARFGRICNVHGDANDDHVAICANGTTRSEVTRGAIEDIDINGIYCNNGYTGVRLLSSGDPVRNISISNIHGRFRLFAVSFTHHYPLNPERPILIENVHLSDIHASKAAAETAGRFTPNVIEDSVVWVEGNVNCKNVVIEKVFRNERCMETKAPTLRVSKGATLENFCFKDCFENYCNEKLPTVINETEYEIIKE